MLFVSVVIGGNLFTLPLTCSLLEFSLLYLSLHHLQGALLDSSRLGPSQGIQVLRACGSILGSILGWLMLGSCPKKAGGRGTWILHTHKVAPQ